MPERLCPRCGAYWACGCVLEEWSQPVDQGCGHDWVRSVGVETDDALPDGSEVVVCRLCGLYAVGTFNVSES